MAAIDFPNSPSISQTFTSAGITWIWTGTVWNIVPPTLIEGHEIVDQDNNPMAQEAQLQFSRLNVTAGAGKTIVTRPADTYIGISPPAIPVEGDVWTDSSTIKTYKWYDGYWIEVSAPPSIVGGGGTASSQIDSAGLDYFNYLTFS